MILIALLLLMVAVPATGYCFMSLIQELVDFWRELSRAPPVKTTRPPAPPPVAGPEWWWRPARTERWWKEHQKPVPEPTKQPVPKKGRPISKTWEELGYKTGVINLQTGEIYEPPDPKEEHE